MGCWSVLLCFTSSFWLLVAEGLSLSTVVAGPLFVRVLDGEVMLVLVHGFWGTAARAPTVSFEGKNRGAIRGSICAVRWAGTINA